MNPHPEAQTMLASRRPLYGRTEHQRQQQVYPQCRVGKARNPAGLQKQQKQRIEGYS